jgi:adenosylmethionine-8-amino-7-oxononanoate aminotransferase
MGSLSERDKKVIWHPYTPQKYAPEPIPVAKGEGVYLIDTSGNAYIDAISSWWVNLHGHANPYIAKKIYEQALTLEQVIFAGFTHEPAIILAERLLQILPGKFSKIFYSDNGSTAVEVAVKMAIQYWSNLGNKQRTKILAFTNSYHGDTFGAMSISDRGIFTLAFHEYLFEVIFIDTPTENNLEELRSTIEKHADHIACFIYEPLLQGAGGMKMYDSGMMNAILSIVKKHDILCVADEVMTGFGRTGKLFAGDHIDQKADIVCLSKGLTGGTMALGATACTEKVHAAFISEDRMKTFFHGHSFTANPLACTAANASLDLLLDKSCIKNIGMIEALNRDFISKLKANDNFGRTVKNPRQLGTIIAFEISSGKDGYLNTISADITRKGLEKGIYLRPLGNTVYLMPPYCITNTELTKIYRFLEYIIITASVNS